MTTWRDVLNNTLSYRCETLDDVVYMHPSNICLDGEFNEDYRIVSGAQFMMWTSMYVYFHVISADKQWVESVPRNPCDVYAY